MAVRLVAVLELLTLTKPWEHMLLLLLLAMAQTLLLLLHWPSDIAWRLLPLQQLTEVQEQVVEQVEQVEQEQATIPRSQ